MNAKEQGLADTIMKMQEPDRLRAEIARLQEAKRRFSDLADERGKESNALRQENERLRAALRGLMEEFRLEFDSQDGRWNADGEPAMRAAASALEQTLREGK